MTTTIESTVRTVLADVQIDGHRLVLPNWLDRADYKRVDQVLRNLGGTWSRYEKAHVFTEDPAPLVMQVVETGEAPGPARSEEGYVATPPELADRLVREHTDIEDWTSGAVLEPSAGGGNLVRAVLAANKDVQVTAVEPNVSRLAALDDSLKRLQLVNGRLEDYLHDTPPEFDAIVANPPFALPGRPTAWIEHTWHAWQLLKPGGRLVSIAPKGLAFREDRKHRGVRSLIANAGGGWHELEPGAFAESGTNVNAVVFWVDKPLDFNPEPPKKKRGKPTEDEKNERREEDREQREAIDAALADPEYAQDLADRVNATPVDCRLRSYSLRNIALVFAQADALGVRVTGHLNTFKGWQEQGRMVAKGSTALRIIAAMGDEAEQQTDEQPGESEQPRKRFRHTSRFDFSQTQGVDD